MGMDANIQIIFYHAHADIPNCRYEDAGSSQFVAIIMLKVPDRGTGIEEKG